jgi:hypothetical protein
MSLEYVMETLNGLHPGATVSAVAEPGSTRYVLVPSAARPALVLPAGEFRAAAAACRAYSSPRDRRARLRSLALATMFRTGLGDQVFRDRLMVAPRNEPSLVDHLSRVVDGPVCLAFPVGRLRSNRKPVIQVIDPAGTVLAFAKLGVDPLTDHLVGHEADALARLARLDLGTVRVPRVLELTTWLGHPLLVSETLATGGRRAPTSGSAIMRAMRDVAQAGGTSSVTLSELPWWDQVSARIAALPASDPATRLRRVHEQLAVVAGTFLQTGAWHGDWNHGNFRMLGDHVLVWDWERFAEGVPLGWDALHLAVWGITPPGGTPTPAALSNLLGSAAQLVAPIGASEATAGLVASLYLLEIGTRMLQDGQGDLGVAMGDISRWLLPVLEDRTRSLSTVALGSRGPVRVEGDSE